MELEAEETELEDKKIQVYNAESISEMLQNILQSKEFEFVLLQEKVVKDEETENEIVDEEGLPFFGTLNPQTQLPTQAFTSLLTKFEKARLLGKRAKEIIEGSPPYVKVYGQVNPLTIAMMELKQKALPVVISRALPNGKVENFPLQDLSIQQVGELHNSG